MVDLLVVRVVDTIIAHLSLTFLPFAPGKRKTQHPLRNYCTLLAMFASMIALPDETSSGMQDLWCSGALSNSADEFWMMLVAVASLHHILLAYYKSNNEVSSTLRRPSTSPAFLWAEDNNSSLWGIPIP